MTLIRYARWLAAGLLAGAAYLGLTAPAQAIPLFARQTGHNCAACHISYPELTAYGREFKLNGYTFGEAQPIPLAFAMMGEYDTMPSVKSGAGASSAGLNHAQFVQYSVFFGGRITDNLGVFGQMSGSGAGMPGTSSFSPTVDNTEARYVHRFTNSGSLEPEAVLGVYVNNDYTMQDVWNAVPAWRFPWFPYSNYPSPLVGPGIPGTFLDNFSVPGATVGIGTYLWWHKTIYAEFALRRNTNGALSEFNWGNGANPGGLATTASTNPNNVGGFQGEAVDNYAPYYRIAYSHDWGYNSVEAGLFGTDARTCVIQVTGSNAAFGSSTCSTGATPNAFNYYRDIGIDSQYQYNKGEPWVYTASGSYIIEHSNQIANGFGDSTLKEFNVRGTAYYNRQYGLTVGWTDFTGQSSGGAYQFNDATGTPVAGSGNPATTYWTLEANYLPMQDLRFSLMYQAFTKLDGYTSGIPGYAGNTNPSDFNRLTGAIWWVF
ncbi:putative high molecular mass cytochrome c [Burkholderiales bacterium GJ-E10]|nr:putative high molecular mass cytochrome c [Burkholderiales bacterium GJ-E10]